ncbi:MAG: hypothetical protein HOP19_13985 [Acidobacteria bacterium]|nr:hypothetical protein [Acidobacteriota bacterium]
MSKSIRTLVLAVVYAASLTLSLFAQTDNSSLPLRRVTLYKHGVAYFERQGPIADNQTVTFLFDAGQMNDVLKSLVVFDLGRGATAGKINGVTYDSTKPLDKRLEEFGLTLDNSNSAGLTALIGQLKGARVEFLLADVSGEKGSTGTIVGIEKKTRTQGTERSDVQELVLLSPQGELFSVPFERLRAIRLLDNRLRNDLEQYLGILQSTLQKNLRRLNITTQGQGARDLFVSYVVEAPIWKTTYRIVLDKTAKPFLQGWAVVDNVQEEDWTNVSLSLIAGAPVSFIQDLQQPRYKQRPVVGLPEDVSITPTVPQAAFTSEIKLSANGGTFRGTVTDPTGAAIGNATIKLRNPTTNAEVSVQTNTSGEYRLSGIPVGIYNASVESPGFKKLMMNGVNITSARTTKNDFELYVASVSETVNVTASSSYVSTDSASIGRVGAMRDEDSGIKVDVSTQDIGELFEYRIATPVTIQRNSSALIPILQNSVEGEQVSLYNQATQEAHPMSAFYLHNTTGLTLESGPLTVIENDTYAGEALTGRIKPNEKRFITYAVDLGCRVSVKAEETDGKPFLAEIREGEFRLHYRQSKTTTYSFSNVSDKAKTVYLEHPYDKDEKWRLAKTLKPMETTENFYRFKVTVAANNTAQFPVTEELPEVDTTAISNLTTEQFTLWIKEGYLTAESKQALEAIFALKTKINALGVELNARKGEIATINQDQNRLRENLRALGKTDEEKQLVQRYVAKLTQGEDQLERLRGEEKRLNEEHSSLQKQINERMEKLAMELRLR